MGTGMEAYSMVYMRAKELKPRMSSARTMFPAASPPHKAQGLEESARRVMYQEDEFIIAVGTDTIL